MKDSYHKAFATLILFGGVLIIGACLYWAGGVGRGGQLTQDQVNAQIAAKVPTKEAIVAGIVADPNFTTAAKAAVKPELDTKANIVDVMFKNDFEGLVKPINDRLAANETAVASKVEQSAFDEEFKPLNDKIAALEPRVKTLEDAQQEAPAPTAEAAPRSNPDTADAVTSPVAGNPPATSDDSYASSHYISMNGYRPWTNSTASEPTEKPSRDAAWMDRIVAKCHIDPPDLETGKSEMNMEMIHKTPDDVLQKLYDGCLTEEQYQASLDIPTETTEISVSSIPEPTPEEMSILEGF
ncbi:MAG TPA: hypothetical protein VHD55_02845 [Candidatus Paceibacterota bacterium]|nr:hypothetical protein [Candidatus Paceibacterota bacterium]